MFDQRRESEKDTERYLREQLEKIGGFCRKWIDPNYRGLPDKICIFPNGTIAFVETKSEGDKPTKIQLRVHQILRDRGCIVEVIDTKEQVDRFMAGLGGLDELHARVTEVKRNVWEELKGQYHS